MVCYLLLLLMCVTLGQLGETSPGHMSSPKSIEKNDCGKGFCDKTKNCICFEGCYITSNGTCEQCPVEGKQCSYEECCYTPDTLVCADEGSGLKYCIRRQNDSFMMAAQVALGAALTIAFVALVALFWKTCPRNPRGQLSSLLRERESSLTSMQRFILQRLRDRPPRYDDNNQIRIEKPPPYEEVTGVPSQLNNTWTDSPPRYSATTHQESDSKNKEAEAATPAQSSEVNDESHLACSSTGIVNSAFTISQDENQTVHKNDGRNNFVFTLTDDSSQSQHMATEHHI